LKISTGIVGSKYEKTKQMFMGEPCETPDYGGLQVVDGYVRRATRCSRHTRDMLERLPSRCEEKHGKCKELYKSPVAD